MAEGNTAGGEDQKLTDIFLKGWNIFDELEVTELPFNGSEFQVCNIEDLHIYVIKTSIERLPQRLEQSEDCNGPFRAGHRHCEPG